MDGRDPLQDRFAELGRACGLEEAVVHSPSQALLLFVEGARRGERHDRDAPAEIALHRPNLGGGLDAAHLGHVAVHENDVPSSTANRLDRQPAVRDDRDLTTHSFEESPSDHLIHAIVFGNEHANPFEGSIAFRFDGIDGGSPLEHAFDRGEEIGGPDGTSEADRERGIGRAESAESAGLPSTGD